MIVVFIISLTSLHREQGHTLFYKNRWISISTLHIHDDDKEGKRRK